MNNRLSVQIPRVLSCHYTMVQYKETKEDKCTIVLQQLSTFRYIGLLILHHNVGTGQYPKNLCLFKVYWYHRSAIPWCIHIKRYNYLFLVQISFMSTHGDDQSMTADFPAVLQIGCMNKAESLPNQVSSVLLANNNWFMVGIWRIFSKVRLSQHMLVHKRVLFGFHDRVCSSTFYCKLQSYKLIVWKRAWIHE